MEVGQLLVKINADLSGLQRGLEQARAQAASAGARIQGALSAATPASRALLTGLAGVGAAMGAAGVKAVGMAGQMEQSRIAFTTMLGSAEEADTFLRQLYDFAAETPFEIEGLQTASRQLLAFGFESEQIIPMMTSIGNAVSGLGGGSVEIERVTRALGQMQAKGKVSAEEMMQLAELGIPAWEILAEKIGTDIPTAMKKAADGGIPASVAIEDLVAGMNERFPNMMEEQSKTLLGQWSTLKDNLSMTMTSIGDEITETFDLKTKLAGILEFLDQLNQAIQEKGLKQALTDLIPPDLQTKIVIVAGAIAGALVPAFISLAAGAWKAMAPLLPFMAAGAALAGLAFLIYRNWEPISTFFRDTWTSITTWLTDTWNGIKQTAIDIWDGIKAFFAEWWETLLTVFTGPIGVLVLLIKNNWDAISAKTEEVWNAISGFLSGIWNGIKNTATAVWNSIKNFVTSPMETAKNLLTNVWNAVKSTVSNIWNGIKSTASTVWNGIKNTIMTPINSVKELLSGVWSGISRTANNAWDGLRQTASRIFGRVKDAILAPFRNIHIPMPHFNLSTVQRTIAGITFPVPRVNVDWYAAGGLFKTPEIIGVGERGPEAVLPLKDSVLREIGRGIVLNFPPVAAGVTGGNIIIQNMQVRNDQDIERVAQRLWQLQQSRARGLGR